MWTKVRLVNLFAFIGITFPILIHHLILSGSTKIPIKVPYISNRLGLWQVHVTFFFQGTKVAFLVINLSSFQQWGNILYNSSMNFNQKEAKWSFQKKQDLLKYKNALDCDKYLLF